MRLVPWGQMLGEAQASGRPPISWLRFSSRTAPTTTCTASKSSAAESWGAAGHGDREGVVEVEEMEDMRTWGHTEVTDPWRTWRT